MPPNELLWSRWDDVDALLSRALDLPSDERADHVVAATVGDEEIRALVLRLLARLATNGDRLTTPSGDVIAGAFGDAPEASDPDLIPGAKVGQFVIGQTGQVQYGQPVDSTLLIQPLGKAVISSGWPSRKLQIGVHRKNHNAVGAALPAQRT